MNAAEPKHEDRDLFGRTPRKRPNWDHRRGEPRTFALAWTVFLMFATLLMFASIGTARIVTVDIYQPAVRILTLTVTIGMVIMWPMVRLSQERPARHVLLEIARDLLVVILPAQALIWPQTLRMLGGWPIEQAAALASFQAAWVLVTGALLVIALQTLDRNRRADLGRGIWMFIILALSVFTPLVQIVLGTIEIAAVPRSASSSIVFSPELASPLMGVHDLTLSRDPILGIPIQPAHWRTIALVGAVGLGLWAIAALLGVALARRRA